MKYAMRLSAYSNITSYGLCSIGLGVVLFIFLKEDLLKIKTTPVKKILLIVLFAVLFVVFSYLSSKLISHIIGGTSNNEKMIHKVILYKKTRWIMMISIVLFAPFVEELIFRKSIFKLLYNRPFWQVLIIASIVFTLLHIVSTPLSWKWIILFIGYFMDAVILGLIYKYSDENIFASILAHMLNNFVMFMIIIN